MSDPNTTTLGNDEGVYTVTITATAQTISQLVTIPSTKSASQILAATLLGSVTAGTARDAVLFGGSDALGYLAAGAEKVFSTRGGSVYLKRSGGSDVTAQIEINWGP